MQQDGDESLQSDRESLEKKLSLLIIDGDRTDFVAQIIIIIIIIIIKRSIPN